MRDVIDAHGLPSSFTATVAVITVYTPEAGITDMDAPNIYLQDKYMPAFNHEFAVKPIMEAG